MPLLEKARDPKCKEEIYGLILEKIQPPQGIVTNTSPALLRPCLTLLLDDRVEIESGIPYMSSIVLSILQDPRSAETLLAALRHFPFLLYKDPGEYCLYPREPCVMNGRWRT